MKWELVPADPPLGWDDLLEEPKKERHPSVQCGEVWIEHV